MNKKDVHILIVDDSSSVLGLLGSYLSDYTCSLIDNGKEAINFVLKEKYIDIILLDVVMDGINGFQVAKQLKRRILTKDIPIVFITSNKDEESILKAFRSGAVDFVNKPVNKSELRARVETQLKLKLAQDNLKESLGLLRNKNIIITQSISYAQRLQKASLPSKTRLDSIFSEYFVLYLPKDIVSGDFYWTYKIENTVIMVVADCTGHGVPGALMSMFGTAFLNEVIISEKIYDPASILDNLREKIINAFNSVDKADIKDGMDVAVVSIDHDKNKIIYAGANNSCIFFKSSEAVLIKGDRMPVGLYDVMRPFSNHEYSITEGDTLYLFSDGYIDQFGGLEGKKFKISRMREKLEEINILPMDQQKMKMLETFLYWKGSEEQIDDILVFGFRY